MNRMLLQTLGVIVVNTLIAAFLSAIGVGHAFVDNLAVSQCIGLAIYAGCILSLRLAPTPQTRLGGVAVAVPAGALAGVALARQWLGDDRPWLSSMAWQALLIGLIFGAAISTLFYLRERMAQLEGELREQRLREALAEKEQADARLRMLQAQIEPHFLFNTLANLAALIRSRPDAAERMLADLIAYLRVGLHRTRSEWTTLGDEIRLLQAYLGILGVRLGDRLRWRLDVPEPLLARAFPPLLLQPLVENAITHGIEPKLGGGELSISARLDDARLQLAVTDTGVGFGGATSGSGLGLDNVRRRLHALYGDTARLAVSENEAGGVTARIELPA